MEGKERPWIYANWIYMYSVASPSIYAIAIVCVPRKSYQCHHTSFYVTSVGYSLSARKISYGVRINIDLQYTVNTINILSISGLILIGVLLYTCTQLHVTVSNTCAVICWMHLLSYNTCCSDKVELIFQCLAPVTHVQCGVKSMHACNIILFWN